MNLMGRRGTPAADFVVTGHWSKRSHAEAGRYGSAHIAASSAQATQLDGREQAPFTWVPATDTWQVRKESAYLHLCSNETIGGVEFLDWPARPRWARPMCRWSWMRPRISCRVRWTSRAAAWCTPARRRTPARPA